MLLVKKGKYAYFCVYRRSYLIWFPVIVLLLLPRAGTGISALSSLTVCECWCWILAADLSRCLQKLGYRSISVGRTHIASRSDTLLYVCTTLFCFDTRYPGGKDLLISSLFYPPSHHSRGSNSVGRHPPSLSSGMTTGRGKGYTWYIIERKELSKGSILHVYSTVAAVYLDPFRTAVPLWRQTTRNLNGLSPKRDCGAKRESLTGTHIHSYYTMYNIHFKQHPILHSNSKYFSPNIVCAALWTSLGVQSRCADETLGNHISYSDLGFCTLRYCISKLVNLHTYLIHTNMYTYVCTGIYICIYIRGTFFNFRCVQRFPWDARRILNNADERFPDFTADVPRC